MTIERLEEIKKRAEEDLEIAGKAVSKGPWHVHGGRVRNGVRMMASQDGLSPITILSSLRQPILAMPPLRNVTRDELFPEDADFIVHACNNAEFRARTILELIDEIETLNTTTIGEMQTKLKECLAVIEELRKDKARKEYLILNSGKAMYYRACKKTDVEILSIINSDIDAAMGTE